MRRREAIRAGDIVLHKEKGGLDFLFSYATAKPYKADTLEVLIRKLPIDQTQAQAKLREYHAALGGRTFDPHVKDGLRTQGLAIDKTNWAQRIDTPPFYAYPVTGGVTFTFGGGS